MTATATAACFGRRPAGLPQAGWRRGVVLSVLLGGMAAVAQDFSIQGFVLGGGGGVSTGGTFGVAGVLGESFQGKLTGAGFTSDAEVTWDAPVLVWLGPVLTTKRVGQTLEIAWSSRHGVFGVQEAPSLDGASWTDSVGAPTSARGQWVLTLPVQANTRFFRLAPASPVLRASRSGANLELSWASGAAGFVLQETTGLRDAAWTDVPSSASIVGDRWVVVLPAPADTRFLRLRGP